MVVDPYKDPIVIGKMEALRQQKYRRGERNATDNRGNPAYVLTEDEKISCLDPVMQKIVRSERAKVKALEDYADPFKLTIGIGELPTSYVVNISHPSMGYARRSKPTSIVDDMADPDAWFRRQINDMRHELGYTKFGQDQGDPSSQQFPGSNKYLDMQEEKRKGSATNERSKAQPLHCPDHGNEMVHGEEPGTMVCLVIGCNRVARKKKRSDAVVKKTEPEAALEDQQVDPQILKNMEDIDTYFNAGASMPDYSAQAGTAAATSIQKLVDSAKDLKILSSTRYVPNQSVPVVVHENGRMYLVQETGKGQEFYIDITVAYPDIRQNRDRSGLTETVVTLNNVRLR